MTLEDEPRDVLFVPIPRTASTSTAEAIRMSLKMYTRQTGIHDKRYQLLNARTRPTHPKCPAESGRKFICFGHIGISSLVQAGVITDEFVSSRYVFSFVRNPWDRIVSLWFSLRKWPRYTRRYNQSLRASRIFDEFIRILDSEEIPPVGPYDSLGLSLANPQTEWIVNDSHRVFRLEDLSVAWPVICGDIGIPLVKFPRRNVIDVGSRKPYREYYTESTRRIVSRKYAEEIERFNYEF
tara:strand:- start:1533 stop:2246 length:714 start_codon:yes stop_codon:yes gene_type:complete